MDTLPSEWVVRSFRHGLIVRRKSRCISCNRTRQMTLQHALGTKTLTYSSLAKDSSSCQRFCHNRLVRSLIGSEICGGGIRPRRDECGSHVVAQQRNVVAEPAV